LAQRKKPASHKVEKLSSFQSVVQEIRRADLVFTEAGVRRQLWFHPPQWAVYELMEKTMNASHATDKSSFEVPSLPLASRDSLFVDEDSDEALSNIHEGSLPVNRRYDTILATYVEDSDSDADESLDNIQREESISVNRRDDPRPAGDVENTDSDQPPSSRLRKRQSFQRSSLPVSDEPQSGDCIDDAEPESDDGSESFTGFDSPNEHGSVNPLKGGSLRVFKPSMPKNCISKIMNGISTFQIQTITFQYIFYLRSFPNYKDKFDDVEEILPFATQSVNVDPTVKENIIDFFEHAGCIAAFTEAPSAALCRCPGQTNGDGTGYKAMVAVSYM